MFVHAFFQFLQMGIQLFCTELLVLTRSFGYLVEATHALVRRARVADIHDIGYCFLYAPGRDVMNLVIGDLLFTAPVGFVDGALHRSCHPVRV